MPTPPAAYARWNSTRSVVTRERWLRPSYVAALMTRLRSVSGPIRPGEKTSGASAVSRTCSTFSGYTGPGRSVPQLADRGCGAHDVVEDATELHGAALPRRELAVRPVADVPQRDL